MKTALQKVVKLKKKVAQESEFFFLFWEKKINTSFGFDPGWALLNAVCQRKDRKELYVILCFSLGIVVWDDISDVMCFLWVMAISPVSSKRLLRLGRLSFSGRFVSIAIWCDTYWYTRMEQLQQEPESGSGAYLYLPMQGIWWSGQIFALKKVLHHLKLLKISFNKKHDCEQMKQK